MSRSAKFATTCVFGCFLSLGAPAQEPIGPAGPPAGASAEAKQAAKAAAVEAEIDRLLAGYDLSPRPLPEIPEDLQRIIEEKV